MNTEQKFMLAKLAMCLTFLLVTTIGIAWLVLSKNPSTLNADAKFNDFSLNLTCDFASQNTAGEQNTQMPLYRELLSQTTGEEKYNPFLWTLPLFYPNIAL